MIRIYNKKEIEILRQGGKLLSKILKALKKKVRVGITTNYLNKVAEDLIFSVGAKPSFKGYNKFPAALCVSINEEIVHAIPSERKLKEGDIVSLDLGIRFKGYCTDMAITVPVGSISKELKKLVWATEESLGLGIEQIKPGNYLGDIGNAIQKHLEKNNFSVVRELVGHGVGKKVHEEPEILNYGLPGQGARLEAGMVLAIEPMATMGDWRIKKGDDGFSYKAVDESLSCHFEHTVVVTKKGVEVITEM